MILAVSSHWKEAALVTNVLGNPEKISTRARLFEVAVEALEQDGWTVARMPGGKSSVRRIMKGSVSKVVSIRTSQDTWIAFPRTKQDKGWRTLDEVDAVVPVSVDDRHNPKFAKVHFIDGDEMRARFNRAYEARKKAGYKMTIGRGIWISLYLPESNNPVTHVGAGAGLRFPPIKTVPLGGNLIAESESLDDDDQLSEDAAPLTISEAKRRLAIGLGVKEANIKITIEA
jgi:hypothetical protein